MSRITYRSKDVAVFDDVLEPAQFDRLLQYLSKAKYMPVHHTGWKPVWRFHDGNPLFGEPNWVQHVESTPGPPSAETIEPWCPTGAPIDALVEWIRAQTPQVEEIIGAAGSDWNGFSFVPWIYPPGSGLSLHVDGGSKSNRVEGSSKSGAFTFFAHPDWRLHWGGYLLVLDPRTPGSEEKELDSAFMRDDVESERVFDPGLALTIFPRPNRLVYISPSAQHLLTRVDVNAGEKARISVAGFFIRSDQ